MSDLASGEMLAASEGMKSKAFEIELFKFGCLMQGIPHARVPQRLVVAQAF